MSFDGVMAAIDAGQPYFGGYVPMPEGTRQFIASAEKPFFYQQAPMLAGSGEEKGIALLHKTYEIGAKRPLTPTFQKIGDCVSHGHGRGVDVLAAVQAAELGDEYTFDACTETIYGGSRVQIGGGKLSGDGSTGLWAVKWLQQYGVIHRTKYLNGKYDFTTYSGDRAKQYGARGNGCPKELEPLAKEHPVHSYALVRTWDEMCDSLANGFPVTICSNVGFARSGGRDADGFLRRSGTWNHCMLIIAFDAKFKRPGALVLNSWGPDWVGGPKRHDQPDGSFWASRDDIEHILSQDGSFSISDYQGFRRRKPKYVIW